MADKSVSGQRVVTAPPEQIFDLLADPARHPEIDGSGSVQGPKDGSQRLVLGSSFGMSMKRGTSYSVTNVVIAYEENREIAWRHGAGGVWRYRLTPVEDGTRVTESFEYGGTKGAVISLLGFPKRNKVAIDATLERLQQALGG